MNAIYSLLDRHAEMLKQATEIGERKEHLKAIYQLCGSAGGTVQPEDYIKGSNLILRKYLSM